MLKKVFGSWFTLFFKLGSIALVTMALVFILFTLANFSDHVNKFFFYVKTNDAEMAKKELVGLHYFYDLSRKWKVQWLADKYLFRDAFFYEVADSYLIHDWGKIIRDKDLQGKLDDPKAYPYGNARFRDKKAQFQKKAIKIEEALNFILTEVAADYEKALRSCLDSGTAYDQCFDRVWNYDLATNKKDVEEVLKGPDPKVKYVLGPPKVEGEIPQLPPPVVPGGSKEEEQNPNSGGPRKRP